MSLRLRAAPNPVASARQADLTYVSDAAPGITRIRHGRAFVYRSPRGQLVRDPATLSRIRSLAIPPAWQNVWICPNPNGHLQATGLDDRGRKQYRYHPRWREVRDQTKFDKLIAFAKALPAIRRRTARDLKRPGMPREKVLAAVVQLLEKTLIRVGNDEYAKANHSYGLTTLRNHHAKVRGQKVRFEFRGKSGVQHEIDLEDPRLARIVRACQDLPNQELFTYLDTDGRALDVTSDDVNAYLKQITGQEFTAKDFRTWAGTVLAAQALQELTRFHTQLQARKNLLRAVTSVAQRLGNTAAVCRKCYIHPAVVESYLDGSLAGLLARRAARTPRQAPHTLQPQEAAVLALLQARLKHEAGRRRAA